MKYFELVDDLSTILKTTKLDDTAHQLRVHTALTGTCVQFLSPKTGSSQLPRAPASEDEVPSSDHQGLCSILSVCLIIPAPQSFKKKKGDVLKHIYLGLKWQCHTF